MRESVDGFFDLWYDKDNLMSKILYITFAVDEGVAHGHCARQTGG